MISFDMDDEQKMITDTVAKFAENEMREEAREADEQCQIPQGIVDKAWELGLLPNNIPEQYGGFGSTHSAVTGALIAEELASGDLSMAMHILAPSLVAFPVLEMGTDEQKEKYLPMFCDDNFKAATAAIIEPRLNFDPHCLSTTAKLDGDGYVLNGEKCYVPLASEADVILVFAANDDTIDAFLVEKGAEGLDIGEREKNMGIKALATHEISLKDCRVPKANRLGGDDGCDLERLLNYSRVGLAAMAVGVAKAAYVYAREYAKEREAFGEPIASRQAIAFMLAEMAIEIDATRLMTWEAAWMLDKGLDTTREACLVKRYASNMVLNVADGAVQTLGGHGYIREHPVEMWFRNGRGFTTFEGMVMV